MADIKIADFCDPIFQQVVKWGLESDAEHPIDTDSARATLNNLIDRLRLASRQQPKIGQQFVQVELPLLFFIDFVMQDRIHLTAPWAELAFERNELAGDEKFFDLLEQTLGSPTDNATDRVEVFYQCMALGFCGTYSPQSPELHRIFRRCALRLGLSPDLVESGQLTPEAYEHLDLVSKHRPFDPRKWRWSVAICVACLVVTHFTNQAVFRSEVQDIRRQLDKIGAYSNLSPAPSVLRKAEEAVLDPEGDAESGPKPDIVLPEKPEAFGDTSMYRLPMEGDDDSTVASSSKAKGADSGKQDEAPSADSRTDSPPDGNRLAADPPADQTDGGAAGKSDADREEAEGSSPTKIDDSPDPQSPSEETGTSDASGQQSQQGGGAASTGDPGSDSPNSNAPGDSKPSSPATAAPPDPQSDPQPDPQPDTTTQTAGKNR